MQIPITIGIIGHRNAILTEDHFSSLREIIDDLHLKYPNSPISLFSQLAKGVDTRVAELFYDYHKSVGRSFSLISVMPYTLEKYKKTFSEQGLEDLDRLMTKSERYIVLEEEELEDLDVLYRRGGQFIADNAVILIAIWELEDNQLMGGTADIVNYKLQGFFSDESTSEYVLAPKGTLISIPCNREDSSVDKEVKFDNHYLDKLLLEDEGIQKTLIKIEEVNRRKSEPNELKNSQNYLYPEDSVISPYLKKLRSFYSLLDSSALNNQRAYKRLLKVLFLLALVVISIYQSYTQIGLHQNVFIAIVAVLGTMLLVFNFTDKWKNHKNYLEDRMLTEALRIQFFWNLACLKEPVSKYILRIYKPELTWIRYFLNSINAMSYENEKIDLDKINMIKLHWIEDQYKYFTSKVAEYKRQRKIFNNISYFFIVTAILLLFAIFILNHLDSNHAGLKWLIVLDTILFGLYGLTKGYFEKRGYDQISNQHELMQSIYKSADERINIILDCKLSTEAKYKRIQELLLKVGREALIENGYWYTIFKDKEPEIEGFAV